MKPAAVDVFIGLGSNLDDPVDQVQRAFVELDALPASRLTDRSPLYLSKPHGPPDQPDYVNAVARLRSTLDPEALLDGLQAIERAHDRVRGRRWGARTLDLDLLLYGDHEIDTRRLVVPHPQLRRRAFVIAPLHDIAPSLAIPGGGTPSTLLRRVGTQGLRSIRAR